MATGDRLCAMDLYKILLLTTRLARRATTSSIYRVARTVILVRLLRFWDYQNTDRGYTVYFDSRTAKSYVHNSSSLHMTASFFSLLDSFHFCPLGYKDFPDFGNTTSSLLSTCCHVVLELWYNWSWVKATWSLEVIFPDGIFPADGKSEIEGKNKYFELFQFNKRVPDKLDASRKALLRALKLFCLGLGLVLQGGFFHGVRSLSFGVDLQEIRLMGVLQVYVIELQ
ncbi:D8Ertd354e protein [Zea mays]|uniref:D8Ertd354e protein n=1 Tax=Zea mays TaxID=4577 RepID=A0A1D6F1C5_MAIZE|nr:D8Ertd354e protein [Zea mays]